MGSAMLKQVDISVFDLDDAEAQEKLVRVHGRVMTVEQLRETLVPKHRKVRQEAVGMKHLYDAIGTCDAKKTKHLFNRLKATVGEAEIFERLEFHLLRSQFDDLTSGKI